MYSPHTTLKESLETKRIKMGKLSSAIYISRWEILKNGQPKKF